MEPARPQHPHHRPSLAQRRGLTLPALRTERPVQLQEERGWQPSWEGREGRRSAVAGPWEAGQTPWLTFCSQPRPSSKHGDRLGWRWPPLPSSRMLLRLSTTQTRLGPQEEDMEPGARKPSVGRSHGTSRHDSRVSPGGSVQQAGAAAGAGAAAKGEETPC